MGFISNSDCSHNLLLKETGLTDSRVQVFFFESQIQIRHFKLDPDPSRIRRV